jgi:hypothetical protein
MEIRCSQCDERCTAEDQYSDCCNEPVTITMEAR